MNSLRLRPRVTAVACAVMLAVAGVAASARAADVESLRAFDEANRLCATGSSPDDFRRAAILFQSIIDRGDVSGAVLYDLGNAWQKAGDLGRALAAYRQAERYRPRDPLLENNTSQVLADLGVPPPARSMVETLVFWRAWLSYPEQAWTFVGLSALAFALGLLALRGFTAARRLAWATTVVACVAGATLLLEVRDVAGTRHGVVVAGQTIARKGNSESYSPAFTEPLKTGTEFVVAEKNGEWLRVRLANDLDGWVPASDVVTW